MVAMNRKLLSCLGYAMRVAKKLNVSPDISKHLNAALYGLQYPGERTPGDDIQQKAADRRTISLVECLTGSNFSEGTAENKYKCDKTGSNNLSTMQQVVLEAVAGDWLATRREGPFCQ